MFGILGAIAVGVISGWVLQRRNAKPVANAQDRMVVRTAGMLPKLPRAYLRDGSLISPPDVLPVSVYGKNGNIYYGRVDTTGSSEFPSNWDNSDVSFTTADIAN